MSNFSTMQTGCLTGGVKKKSDVNVLPEVAQAWEEVRDDGNTEVDWVIASYKGNSKTDITVLAKGNGGVTACAKALEEFDGKPLFGGCRTKKNRFVSFFYTNEHTTSVMKRGRASMHKNGVLNVLQGCDSEISITPTFTEDNV